MDLKLPVDFERLPEFRLLGEVLDREYAKRHGANERAVAAASVFVWMRLWVELSYLAQTTNRPGILTKQGAALYERSLDPMFGDDFTAIKALEESGCLRADGEEWFCERFSKMNPHLAGNYKSKELRGAAGSALERNKKHIAHEAMAQAMLLGPDAFKKKDGAIMTEQEIQKSMVLIKTLDNCLKSGGRTKAQYSEGIVADACEVITKYPELRTFYIWVATNRDHPSLPKTTEQILGRFEEYYRLSQD